MGARISQGPKRVPAARGIKMSTNHTPVDHSARIVPGKRGSTPRSLQARYSVSDDEWPTSHSPCSEQLNGPNQLCLCADAGRSSFPYRCRCTGGRRQKRTTSEDGCARGALRRGLAKNLGVRGSRLQGKQERRIAEGRTTLGWVFRCGQRG